MPRVATSVLIEPLPTIRPWPPDTDCVEPVPPVSDQACPSEAVPQPLATLRPAKVSWAKIVPDAMGNAGGGDGEDTTSETVVECVALEPVPVMVRV